MKRKITLTIDSDIYDRLVELPRKVSVSEYVNWVLRIMLEEVKAGRELSSEEIRAFVAKTPDGKEFLDRVDEYVGPKFKKIEDELGELKQALASLVKKRAKKEK